jgi:drug/metabolite transporter (DMT)-like permease
LAEALAARAPGLPAAALDRTGLLCLSASVIFLSSGWPLAKLAIDRGTTPLWFAESRATLSALVAFVIVTATGRLRLPRRGDWPAVLAVGTLQTGLFFVFSHIAVSFVQAGRTAVLANTTVYFVVPLSLVFLGERIPLRRWLAAGLGVAGVVVLMGPWAIDWAHRDVLIGHGFLLLAGFSFSVAIVVVRARPPQSAMFTLLPWCFLIASLVVLPLLLIESPHGTFGTAPISWGAVLYIGLLAGPLGTWGIVEATMRLPTVVASVGFLATPATGILLSNLILGERLTPDLLAGTALILGGVALAAFPRRRAPGRRFPGRR